MIRPKARRIGWPRGPESRAARRQVSLMPLRARTSERLTMSWYWSSDLIVVTGIFGSVFGGE